MERRFVQGSVLMGFTSYILCLLSSLGDCVVAFSHKQAAVLQHPTPLHNTLVKAVGYWGREKKELQSCCLTQPLPMRQCTGIMPIRARKNPNTQPKHSDGRSQEISLTSFSQLQSGPNSKRHGDKPKHN
ncbi:hypothetical protein VTI28DRAFT_6586 [Corynascus sepedonium]